MGVGAFACYAAEVAEMVACQVLHMNMALQNGSHLMKQQCCIVLAKPHCWAQVQGWGSKAGGVDNEGSLEEFEASSEVALEDVVSALLEEEVEDWIVVAALVADTVEHWIGSAARDVAETAEHWLVGDGGLGAAV